MAFFKSLVQRCVQYFGYTLKKDFYPDLEKAFLELQKTVAPYTMTHLLSQYAMYKATKYVLAHNIQGDIVECGVWRGGVSMVVASVLKEAGSTKQMYLYDTYEGMSVPTEHDKRYDGMDAAGRFNSWKRDNGESAWCYASLEEVTHNMETIGYPHVTYVRGKVEDTIPHTMPQSIAILRLDTDWYESTKHELEHLFPLLVPGGVLVLDDYGQWEGAKKAYDEYAKAHGVRIFLNRIDHSARIGIK
ncbi:MAG: hypothetical protein RLZZ234_270 [Candidatus Parcubacteria bacterium]|jgi:hypothetical protein